MIGRTAILIALMFAVQMAVSNVTTPHQRLGYGHCYTMITDNRRNWTDAEKDCELNVNGRLACFHSAFESNIVAAWLPFLSSDPWIGLFQNGSSFQWTDGTTYQGGINWAPGSPTNSSLCVQICHSSGNHDGVTCQQGKWRTADCANSTSQFFCEYGCKPASTTKAP